jgi:hypothetical protein
VSDLDDACVLAKGLRVCVFVCLQVTGELSVDPQEVLHDIQGGFFCDEPGLGKTVTALSLILKTQVRHSLSLSVIPCHSLSPSFKNREAVTPS